MEIDSLYLLVTEAIVRAETLTDLGAPGAAAAHLDLSFLEEKIAGSLPASDPEGALARRGAVRAAVVAGHYGRAGNLGERFSSDPGATDQLRAELRELLRDSASGSQRQRSVAKQYRWAAKLYGVDNIARVQEARLRQAEPLPIG